MIATSTTDPVKFTPSWLAKEDNPPIFYLRAGSSIERGLMEAELAGEHMAGEIGSHEVREAVLNGVEQLFAGDAEYDRIVSVVTAEPEEVDAFTLGDKALSEAVYRMLGTHWAPYRELLARRARRQQLAPLIALQRFCAGWENVKTEKGDLIAFARDPRGFVSEAALVKLPRYDMLAAGNRAYAMQFGGGEEKNSEQPSASGEGQMTSQEG